MCVYPDISVSFACTVLHGSSRCFVLEEVEFFVLVGDKWSDSVTCGCELLLERLPSNKRHRGVMS